jgi:hypothetical protein
VAEGELLLHEHPGTLARRQHVAQMVPGEAVLWDRV